MSIQSRENDVLRNSPSHERIVLFSAILLSVMRLTLLIIVILVLINLLPEEKDIRALGIGLSLLVLGSLYGWFVFAAVKRVRRSRFPVIRAAEGMASTVFVFLAVFATIYTFIDSDSNLSFSEDLTPFTALYFAMTVLATVGFGDITPISTVARSFAMVQMALDIVLIGVTVKVFSGAVNKKRQVKNPETGDTEK